MNIDPLREYMGHSGGVYGQLRGVYGPLRGVYGPLRGVYRPLGGYMDHSGGIWVTQGENIRKLCRKYGEIM